MSVLQQSYNNACFLRKACTGEGMGRLEKAVCKQKHASWHILPGSKHKLEIFVSKRAFRRHIFKMSAQRLDSRPTFCLIMPDHSLSSLTRQY